MRSANFLLCAAAAAVLASVVPTRAEPMIGVNNVHLGWMKPAERDAAIDDMVKAGVHAVRLDLRAPYPAFIDAAEELSRRGLAVDLVIDLSTDYLIAPNAPIRSGRGQVWNVPHLSDLNLDSFKQRFSELLAEIERRGIKVLAFEMGNEINWAGFNGDLAVSTPHQRPDPGAGTVEHLRDPKHFLEGLRRYVEALTFVKTLRDRSRVNMGAKIISGGLADIPVDLAADKGSESVSLMTTLKLLIGLGMGKVVDGYGVHFYPNPKLPYRTIAESFAYMTSQCTSDHPCWVTEWGVANSDLACQSNEATRLQAMTVLRAVFHDASKTGRIAAYFVYDWGEKDDPWGITKCGALTGFGKELLAPNLGIFHDKER